MKTKKLKIEKCEIENPNFILVCNFPKTKKVSHIGCFEPENKANNPYRVGMWSITYKNQ